VPEIVEFDGTLEISTSTRKCKRAIQNYFWVALSK